MDFYDQIRRIERLDYLLHSRSTGTPEELAEKLGISTSQVYQIIKQMKQELNAPIYYSRFYRSYCYRENVKFVCKFEILKESFY